MQGRASVRGARAGPGRRRTVGLRIALLSAPILGLGCAGPLVLIGYDASGRRPPTPDGLLPVHSTRVGAAFARPGVRFAEYDAVLFDPVTVSYAENPRRTEAPERTHGGFITDESMLLRLKHIFHDAFDEALGTSNAFAIATEGGPRVLRVSPRIVDLELEVPRWHGSEIHFVTQIGAMTLVLDVRDSQTDARLAHVADRRAIRPSSGGLLGSFESNPVNNWGALRDIFADWARMFRDGLEDLRAFPELPPPDAPTVGGRQHASVGGPA